MYNILRNKLADWWVDHKGHEFDWVTSRKICIENINTELCLSIRGWKIKI